MGQHKIHFFRTVIGVHAVIYIFSVCFILFSPTRLRAESLGDCSVVPGGNLGHPDREALEYVGGGGFEDPSAPWIIEESGSGAVTKGVSGAEFHGGGHSFQVDISGASTLVLKQKIYFVKGFEYTLSLWVKGNFTGLEAKVIQYDAADNPTSKSRIELIRSGTTYDDWTELTTSLEISDNGTYYQVEVTIIGAASLFIDDISVSAQVYKKTAITDPPSAPLFLAWLIHIEDPQYLVDNETTFRTKTKIFEELAKVFHANNARLIIQPELEILLGAEKWDPTWVERLTRQYGVTWSTHTHGPDGDDVTMDDVIAYTLERKLKMEEMGAETVTDHNGNFEMTDLGRLSEIGFKTISAYKYKYTQFPPLGYYLNPWRPSSVSPLSDEARWAIHDRSGKLIFIPGTGSSITRYKFQLYDLTERYLTAALSKVQAEQINTYTFVDHVDHFFSLNGQRLDEYVNSADFTQDLASYDTMLKNLINPLVASGHVVWKTIPEMQTAYEQWERDYCPATPTGSILLFLPGILQHNTGTD